jgi:hypothetical protein
VRRTSAWALERLERDFTRATGRPMHHNTRELLRDNFREAELRARVIELGLIAVIVMFLGLLLRRHLRDLSFPPSALGGLSPRELSCT